MAPSTVEEAFYDIVEAFNLSEEYQVPVIFLTDLQLSLGKQTVEPLKLDKVEIRRGKLDLEAELPERENKAYFKRYEVTERRFTACFTWYEKWCSPCYRCRT